MRYFNIIFVIGLFFVTTYGWAKNTGKENSTDIVVYRSPSCSCCGKWVDHLKQNHFNVQDIVTEDVQAIKDKYGVPKQMASCHTAIVNGYVVEGHVPSGDILTLLKNKPKVIGIAAPGMPVGTPGMEIDEAKHPYEIVSFDRDQRSAVFSKH